MGRAARITPYQHNALGLFCEKCLVSPLVLHTVRESRAPWAARNLRDQQMRMLKPMETLGDELRILHRPIRETIPHWHLKVNAEQAPRSFPQVPTHLDPRGHYPSDPD